MRFFVDFVRRCIMRFPKVYDSIHWIVERFAKLLYVSEISHSTNFEDIIAKFYCNQHRGKVGGFYVDIGALDPFRFSNTYALYLAGWRGINIEPRRDSIQKFNKYRKRDINLNIGVSLAAGELEYYSFAEPAYNTTEKDRADYVVQQGYSKLLEYYKIATRPLKEIFQQNDVLATGIDFMAIDVEGHELAVLQSNDWLLYRPFFIAMESLLSKQHGYDVRYLDADPAVKFCWIRATVLWPKSEINCFSWTAGSRCTG